MIGRAEHELDFHLPVHKFEVGCIDTKFKSAVEYVFIFIYTGTTDAVFKLIGGNNYISLYWGNREGDWKKNLTKARIKEIEAVLER